MAAKKVKVSQATIDKIKKLGMTAALKRAGSSSNAEYIEGIRRMYGERRLAAAQGGRKPQTQSPRVAERSVQAKSPRVAERSNSLKNRLKTAQKQGGLRADKPLGTVLRSGNGGINKGSSMVNKVGTKPASGKLPYYYTDAEKAYVKAYGKPGSKKKSTTSTTKPTKAQIAYGKARAGGR